jgi:hypothetical protein
MQKNLVKLAYMYPEFQAKKKKKKKKKKLPVVNRLEMILTMSFILN